MRHNFLLVFVVLLVILAVIELYSYKAFKTLGIFGTHKKIAYITYWLWTTLVFILLIYTFITYPYRDKTDYSLSFFTFGILILNIVPKLVFSIFHLVDDISALILKSFSFFTHTQSYSGEIITRRYFLTQIGAVVAAIPFSGILYGMIKGKYNYQVKKIILHFDKLPKSFDGIKIVQISDIHIGSFNRNFEAVQKGIEFINQADADYVFFTGDLVNNYAAELDGWLPVLQQIKAKRGKYSILGNHDYGDYVPWNSEEEKHKNLLQLLDFQRKAGFQPLLNTNEKLTIKGEYIRLIGVENWGLGGFSKYGDLEKAMKNTAEEEFKILLSHDPSHFDAQVKTKTNIDLTLSGHTHGMQFGVEIGNFKWSPAKYRYPKWAGLYKENNQYLYVNRGFGFIGFPGRVGILPEITVIELKA